ncbi:MAG: hypothetical protein L3J11_02845 [Draconibacterium sp.]|nr:hypothetical protein [Draconibacterium sp.]
MTGIDEVILCDNKAKNVAIAIVTARLFNEVSVQKNELKRSGYFITIPKEIPHYTFFTRYNGMVFVCTFYGM